MVSDSDKSPSLLSELHRSSKLCAASAINIEVCFFSVWYATTSDMKRQVRESGCGGTGRVFLHWIWDWSGILEQQSGICVIVYVPQQDRRKHYVSFRISRRDTEMGLSGVLKPNPGRARVRFQRDSCYLDCRSCLIDLLMGEAHG